MFSVGVIAYFLVFQRVPFKGGDLKEITTNNRKGLFDFHPRMKERMHPELLDLVFKMLDEDSSKRITAHQALEHRFMQINFNEEMSGESTA